MAYNRAKAALDRPGWLQNEMIEDLTIRTGKIFDVDGGTFADQAYDPNPIIPGGDDGNFSGWGMDDQEMGEDGLVGELVYLGNSDTWWLCDADDVDKSTNLLGILTENTTTGNVGRILFMGFTYLSTWNWIASIGGPLYISPTPGAITVTQPSVTGQQVRKIGYPYSATVVYFNPSTTVIEL